MTTLDPDLRSVQEARDALKAAKKALRSFENTSQEKVDAICEAMVAAAMREAAALGREAHEETGFGKPDHKRIKNEFAAASVWAEIKDRKTCGVLREIPERGITEIGAPVGVIVALVPSTNPTSTAIYKILIAVKARNAIVVAPHPAAARCTARAVQVMIDAGRAAGMPEGLVSCLTTITASGTEELMSHPLTSLVLATGGPGMVKAAHSGGKPAIGVGPGNVPVYVDRSADIEDAARKIIASKSFDCSTICASEQAILADAPIAERLKQALVRNGAHWLDRDEANRLGAMMFRPNGMGTAESVGKTPQALGELAGIKVPADARVLIADLEGIGPAHPLSREKLTSVLGFMVVDDWRQGCERATEMLRFGGDGHSMALHTTDMDVALAFGLEKPAFRVLVNTWSSLGGVGGTTGLVPALTLAPGGIGGAAVSDNITVDHVLNTRRIARHLVDPPAGADDPWGGLAGRPVAGSTGQSAAAAPVASAPASVPASGGTVVGTTAAPAEVVDEIVRKVMSALTQGGLSG